MSNRFGSVYYSPSQVNNYFPSVNCQNRFIMTITCARFTTIFFILRRGWKCLQNDVLMNKHCSYTALSGHVVGDRKSRAAWEQLARWTDDKVSSLEEMVNSYCRKIRQHTKGLALHYWTKTSPSARCAFILTVTSRHHVICCDMLCQLNVFFVSTDL